MAKIEPLLFWDFRFRYPLEFLNDDAFYVQILSLKLQHASALMSQKFWLGRGRGRACKICIFSSFITMQNLVVVIWPSRNMPFSHMRS